VPLRQALQEVQAEYLNDVCYLTYNCQFNPEHVWEM
jgi:hypothetical protein